MSEVADIHLETLDDDEAVVVLSLIHESLNRQATHLVTLEKLQERVANMQNSGHEPDITSLAEPYLHFWQKEFDKNKEVFRGKYGRAIESYLVLAQSLKTEASPQNEVGNMLIKTRNQLRNELLFTFQQYVAESENMASLEEEARTDILTGLLSRRGMQAYLDKNAPEPNHNYSIIQIDLDNFKQVNDTHDHSTGDEALQKAAEFMREATAEVKNAACVRTGGDELTIILPDIGEEDATYIAEKLRTRAEKEMNFGQGSDEVSVTMSIGVASVMPNQEGPAEMFYDPDVLMQAADIRAGHAKKEPVTGQQVKNRVINSDYTVVRQSLNEKMGMWFSPLLSRMGFEVVSEEHKAAHDVKNKPSCWQRVFLEIKPDSILCPKSREKIKVVQRAVKEHYPNLDPRKKNPLRRKIVGMLRAFLKKHPTLKHITQKTAQSLDTISSNRWADTSK